jgi:Predicted dehydrogenases and related proteins
MLTACIAGLGGIGKNKHIPALKKLSGEVKVTGVTDARPERMDEAEKLLGYPVGKYADFKEMILKEKPDFADICTPNFLHDEFAVFALENGVNVVCEKPDAVSVERAAAMREAAEKSGKTLMVIRNNRFLASSQKLKAMADAGDFGELYTGRCGWIRRRGIPGSGGWFTTKAQSGGGPLIDLGVHMLDLALYIMGNPKVISVSGSTYNKFANSKDKPDSVHSKFGDAAEYGTFDVEDLAIGFLKLEGGKSLQIEFSWASNIKRETRFVELRGEKLGFNWKDGAYSLYGPRPLKRGLADCLSRLNQLRNNGNGHEKNLAHFIKVLKGEEKPVFTPDQGVNMIKILTGIYRSAETGREVIF